MQPRKLKVAIVSFPYGGNGGTSSEHPDVRTWLLKTVIKIKADPRIEDVFHRDFNDTPITMTRNEASYWAQEVGADVLVMVDSDQAPDLYLGQPGVKPFWDSSFDFLYSHWDKGPVAIFAPYCGPPTHPINGGFENPYVFRWVNKNTDHVEGEFAISAYSRAEASYQSGLQEAAAGPTGLCMIDIRCFDHLEDPRFYYEYEGDGAECPTCHHPVPGKQTHKDSTEDVVFFRNLSQNVLAKLGYNPVFCNWDAWAGHWKPWCVGKPNDIKANQVNKQLRNAVLLGQKSGWSNRVVRRNPNLPVHPDDAKGVKLSRFETNDLRRTFGKVMPDSSEADQFQMLLTPEEANGMTKADVDDPRWLTAPVEKPEEFPEVHNTDAADLAFLQEIVASQGARAKADGRTLRIVELGSWVGKSACAMAEAAKKVIGDEFEIHCIDHFRGDVPLQRRVAKEYDVFAEFKKNTAQYGCAIIAHRNDTATAAKNWAKRKDDGLDDGIDILFIDADHSYEGCLADILNWFPFMRYGGTCCGHDFNQCFPGVRRAVTECFGWEAPVQGNVWLVKKGLDELLYKTNGEVHESHAH